jgi:SagB-type dehydrogenase family enzyme
MRVTTMIPNPFVDLHQTFSEFDGIAELFHENTKLGPLYPEGLLEDSIGDKIPTPSLHQRQAITQAFKVYDSAPQIKLPNLESLPPLTATFQEVIARRHTVHHFKPADPDLADLSRLLNLTYGINRAKFHSDGSKAVQFFRACPSAGALYPLEFYVVALRPLSALPTGLYHFNVRGNALEQLRLGDIYEELQPLTMPHQPVELRHVLGEGTLAIIMTAVFGRNMVKYSKRGYRYLMYEAGHAMQNLLLAAHAGGYQAFQSGAFDDDRLSDLLDIHGVEEAPLYYAVIGG